MTAKENQVSNQVTRQDVLIGELTAALAADSMTVQDALPPAFAARAIAAGEMIVPLEPRVVSYDTVVLPPPVAASDAPYDTIAVRPRRTFVAWGGWLAAAALLAVWVRDPSSATATSGGLPARQLSIAGASAAASRVRDSLMTTDSAITRIVWSPTTDSAALGAGGDVVWSTRAQRGVMRLIGLESNDARRWQYQLWIFDKARDQRYPVDGGVFDVPAGATEVFVSIIARVPIGDAVMFAVTVEAPGGVVVSTRERVALLAAL
ncbi:hypothetical protein [Gemmatimonas sp.]|uniref:hypothetical protein n=1 Tax=Gemmatimonas sp. TaxID=1962908 RepID=UPI0035683BE2